MRLPPQQEVEKWGLKKSLVNCIQCSSINETLLRESYKDLCYIIYATCRRAVP